VFSLAIASEAWAIPNLNAAQCTQGNNPAGSTASCAVAGQLPCSWQPAGLPLGSVSCDLGPICPTVGFGAKAILVENTATPNITWDYVLSGECGANGGPPPVTFCCAIEDPGGEIDYLGLVGTELEDNLSFWHIVGQPSAILRSLDGEEMWIGIRGLGSHDLINGTPWQHTGFEEEQIPDLPDYVNEHLYGDQGDDDIFAWGGVNDWLYGGEGNDILFGDQGSDIIDAGPGTDAISGGQNADTIVGGAGDDDICGDLAILDLVQRTVECVPSVSGWSDFIDAGNGDDDVDAGRGGGSVLGGPGRDTICGTAQIWGGENDDTIFSDGGAVVGNAGTDVCGMTGMATPDCELQNLPQCPL
jgi:Ca2+-binding RTX toxin-like protein